MRSTVLGDPSPDIVAAIEIPEVRPIQIVNFDDGGEGDARWRSARHPRPDLAARPSYASSGRCIDASGLDRQLGSRRVDVTQGQLAFWDSFSSGGRSLASAAPNRERHFDNAFGLHGQQLSNRRR